MARAPILAAGGIVTQRGNASVIAVVRLRKRNEWVLPKGKLDDGETPRAAAEREVLEETGHLVSVHEFLGTLAYEAGGRPKVVHYWRMEADREPTHELMRDVKAVAWLPLDEAVERLTRSHEQAFLAEVGPLALEAAASRAAPARRPAVKRAAAQRPVPIQAESVSPTGPSASTHDEPTDVAAALDIAEADSPALAPEPVAREYPVAPHATERKTILEKAWRWLRGRA
jgi:8-oxo-dGTP diphosphatase